MKPLTVVVSAGTYFHPFDRLIDWITPWSVEHPDVRFIVQHGPGHPMPGAVNHEFVAYEKLLALFVSADVIVLQGGAGGVMDARELGRVPIVVPRRPVGGEVVDNHQLIFTRTAADLGLVYCADSEDELRMLLDSALAGALSTHRDTGETTPGSANLAALLASSPALLPIAARRRRLLRSLRLLLGHPSTGPIAVAANETGNETLGNESLKNPVNTEP